MQPDWACGRARLRGSRNDMRVLVTRAVEDASDIAAELVARGHEPLIAPLLDIQYRGGPPLDLSAVQAVLATSKNGVRALALRTTRRDLPILAVGPQTAAAARALGFANVRHANGDAVALANAVPDWATPDKGLLFYAAGAERSSDLADRLTMKGYTVRTHALYEAVEITVLPAGVRGALEHGLLDAVLVFSPRSARILVDRLSGDGLAQACRTIDAYAISAAAAEPLKVLPFRSIHWASQPSRESLLALLT